MADLTQRLSLIVDAAGDKSEAVFRRLTSEAEKTSSASKDAGISVAAAADRVAAAKMKEADAYGKLRVEEEKLKNLRDAGNASTAQIAAAEERVSSAQRRVQAATAETTRATEAQTKANREAVASTDEVGESSSKTADKLREFGGEIAGLVAGFSLVDYLSESVTGFMDLARGAGDLAASMNATIEQGGQLAALFGAIGLESGDLLEIQAEFAGKVAESKDGLTLVGTEVKTNANGTTNWARTIQDVLGELQKIPDATERNRLGFQMFGEEGYKQLATLVNSGTSVADAFEKIGFPVTQDDYDAIVDYDAAMLDLSLTSGRFGQSIGRLVVPALTMLAELGMDIANGLGAIPGPMALTVAGAIGLGFAMRSAAVEGSFLATTMARVSASAAGLTASMGAAFASTTAFGTAAAGAARSALGFIGGPLGAGLIAAGAAYYFASEGADEFREKAREAAVEVEAAAESGKNAAITTEVLARRLAEEAGVWDGLAASRRGARTGLEETGGALGWLDDITGGGLSTALSVFDETLGEGELAAVGFADEIDTARENLEGLDEQTAVAQITMQSLNDLIASGDLSSGLFAQRVREAAEAQAEETKTADTAAAAIQAYTDATTGAFEATTNLLNAQLSGRDAYRGVVEAAEELAETEDDLSTNIDETAVALDNVLSKALDFGETMGDVAVANARAGAEIVTPLREAEIRASEMVTSLRESLNVPDLTDTARVQIEDMIAKLEEAKTKGDVEAILTLTGAEEAAAGIDTATEDRDTTVTVESRNGPAVISYLDGIASAERLAIVRVESRNGPAVETYLESLRLRDRLALIRVESRNGPAVDSYLDSLTRERLAIIRVETRGGPAVDQYLDSLANQARTAVIGTRQGAAPTGLNRGAPAMVGAGMYGAGGTVNIQQLTVNTVTDSGGRLTPQAQAEAGRNYAAALDTWARKSGWRAP